MAPHAYLVGHCRTLLFFICSSLETALEKALQNFILAHSYTRAAILTCDVYPLNVLFSDLIANTKPAKLVNLMNQH